MDGAGRLRVVVIDDDEPVLRLLRDVLEDEGFFVATMARPPRDPGEVALVAPDLIVLDLHFRAQPDGHLLLARLKADPRTAAVPVLVCSAARDLLARLEADLDRWSCGVVAKPFDLDVLLDTVQSCLEGADRTEAAG